MMKETIIAQQTQLDSEAYKAPVLLLHSDQSKITASRQPDLQFRTPLTLLRRRR
jgi:hypothetical protein